MRGRGWLTVVALLALAACGDPDPASGVAPASSSWRFVSLEVHGSPVPVTFGRPMFVDVYEEGFRADTTCNTITGERFGAQVLSTLMACSGEAGELERPMSRALATVPTDDGDHLVFDDGTVRLVYERYTEPSVTDLFAVLGEAAASVDASTLPSEAVTGSVPPSFDALVPVPSPSPDLDLFLARASGDPCVVFATASSLEWNCIGVRGAAEVASAFDVPFRQAPLARVALIPDRFAAAVAARPELGSYASNILVVAADAPEGRHVLTDTDGNELALYIPPPRTDPPAAASTTAPPVGP